MKLLPKTSIIHPLFLLVVCLIFFWPFFTKGKIPIPADTIVGMYYPWRDVVWDGYTAGIPFKNYIITDPVRQQYLWKKLAIDQYKNFQWPLWNPYTHSGMPLLANFQTGAFYPLNLIFFILPFNLAWGFYIFLQPLLASFFCYLFLRHLKLQFLTCLFGGLIFSFSGFMTAWLEWGNIGHTLLWLPLILLSIEKIIFKPNSKKWILIFIFTLVSQFFAGHLQTSFYVIVFSFTYLIFRLFTFDKAKRLRTFLLFIICYLLFVLITAIQWLPTLELIKNSAREIDQTDILKRPDWFLPWKHLLQLIVPDFFGNPTTGNYWGVWNYGEFVSFIGVIPLFLVFLAVFNFKKNNHIKFFLIFLLINLSFALPTPWAKIPYLLKIPFFDSAQPSRLIGLIDFFLAILAAFGFDRFFQKKQSIKKEEITGFTFLFLLITSLWFFIFQAANFFPEAGWLTNLKITQRNLILPTFVLGVLFLLLIIKKLFHSGTTTLQYVVVTWLFVFLAIGELFRFGWKFNPFSSQRWIFPSTKIIEFLKQDNSLYRIMSVDRRLFPANFAIAYYLQTVSGYDPLYLKDYGFLITKLESGKEGLASFNRIIEPANYQSSLVDQLNVKYILSLQELETGKLKKVCQEGETRLYENLKVLPRVKLYPEGEEEIKILTYKPAKIKMQVRPSIEKNLILADMFYPGWSAKINNLPVQVLKTNENFRQIKLITGNNLIEFFYQPKSFYYGLLCSFFGIITLILLLIFKFWRKEKL